MFCFKCNKKKCTKTMLSYCLKCKKNTENINPEVSKTSNAKIMMLSRCAIYGTKKSKFIKKQVAKGLLNSLGIKAPFSNIPLPMWRDVF